jgi:hypothetical protein
VVFDLLLIGLVITLEPIPLTAFVLVLASKNGVRKGAAFIFGWLFSLAVVVVGTVLVTGNKPPAPNTAPSLGALAAKIAIGVVLLGLAVRQQRKMHRPRKPKKTPKWQTGIDNMSPWYAMGLAPLTQPWGLVAAGVATITGAKLSSWQSYVVLILFCLVATGVYIALEIYAGFWSTQAQAFLASVKQWIDTHTDQVIIVVSLVLGFWLIGKSIYLIVT